MKSYVKKIRKSYQYEMTLPDRSAPLSCLIVFSDRKSLSVRVKPDGEVEARAPLSVPGKYVETFLESKKSWILEKRQEALANASRTLALTREQKEQAALLAKKLRRAARKLFPLRVAHYHRYTGGAYTSVSVRSQKTRWGSCSSRGALSFNDRLLLAPPEVLDYVVVHELCHLTYMNHSKAFWDMVERVLPDYRRAKLWLKEHGRELTPEAAAVTAPPNSALFPPGSAGCAAALSPAPPPRPGH